MARYIRVKQCLDCGKDISDRGNAARRCVVCADVHKREYHRWYDRLRKFKKRWDLGTSDFSEHRNDDFDVEHGEILDEMIRLGLRKRPKKRQ